MRQRTIAHLLIAMGIVLCVEGLIYRIDEALNGPRPHESDLTTADAQEPRVRISGRIAALTDTSLVLRISEWASGRNLPRALLEAGKCGIERLTNNECAPNGFFIRDTDTEVDIPFSADLRIWLQRAVTDDDPTPWREVDAHGLAHYLDDAEYPPFFWVTVRNGSAVKIEEQHIP